MFPIVFQKFTQLPPSSLSPASLHSIHQCMDLVSFTMIFLLNYLSNLWSNIVPFVFVIIKSLKQDLGWLYFDKKNIYDKWVPLTFAFFHPCYILQQKRNWIAISMQTKLKIESSYPTKYGWPYLSMHDGEPKEYFYLLLQYWQRFGLVRYGTTRVRVMSDRRWTETSKTHVLCLV